MFTFKDTISYIWPIIRKHKWKFYFIFIVSFLRVFLGTIVNPIFYKKIIDLVSKAGIDKAAVTSPLWYYVFWVVVVAISGWFFSRFSDFLVSSFQSKVMKDMHDFSFSKLQGQSYLFFADNFSGSLVNKSRKFVRAFESMHDILIDNFWSTFVALVSIFFVLFFQAKSIALLFLGFSFVYGIIIVFMSKKRIQYEIAESAADSRVTGYIADSITNILATKSSAASNREIEGFKKVTDEDETLRLRAWKFANRQTAAQSSVLILVQVMGVIMSTKLWLSGEISAGVFILVQSYMVSISGMFWQLGRSMTKFTKNLSDMKEMVDIFKKIPDVVDPINPEKSIIKDGSILFKNMNFDYGTGSDVFADFNLDIKPGEKVGLVGHSGSGKSTLTKLLMRFIDIGSGEILIDGQNIQKITQDDLRRNIAYISQEPVLFHRSIRENIAYGWPQATEQEIVDVAKKAHAHDFISKLKFGYDTMVGERGVKLSGGERQRVAIARAMLKQAPILVLDEATSSLDSISESYIQEAFEELMKGKTTIVIAHRLSTIQKMDRIIVLDQGKIVEEGTHKELLAKNGFYADLWNHQTGGFLKE